MLVDTLGCDDSIPGGHSIRHNFLVHSVIKTTAQDSFYNNVKPASVCIHKHMHAHVCLHVYACVCVCTRVAICFTTIPAKHIFCELSHY